MEWADIGYFLGGTLLFFIVYLTIIRRNRIFQIPSIKVSRAFDRHLTYVARLRGYYSYEAYGATKYEAIGKLIELIDNLKHSPNNKIVDGH